MLVALMASLGKFQPAVLAAIDCAQGIDFAFFQGAASVLTFRDVVAAASIWSSVSVEGPITASASDSTDVPDLEVVVPGCGLCDRSARDGSSEGGESDKGGVELHCCGIVSIRYRLRFLIRFAGVMKRILEPTGLDNPNDNDYRPNNTDH